MLLHQPYDLLQTSTPRFSRRLVGKILMAFDHACEQRQLEVAEQLLQVLETALLHRMLPPDVTQRRNAETLVAAHERLWELRHPPTPE